MSDAYLLDCVVRKHLMFTNSCNLDCHSVTLIFFGGVEDGKWWDSVRGNSVPCRWPVLTLHHLEIPSAMYPSVACATQWVLLILSGLYRPREMRATHPSSERVRRKAERCMFHCARWHWRTSTSSSDGGSSSAHINHSLRGLPCFQSSSAALTFLFLFHYKERFFLSFVNVF